MTLTQLISKLRTTKLLLFASAMLRYRKWAGCENIKCSFINICGNKIQMAELRKYEYAVNERIATLLTKQGSQQDAFVKN